MQHLAVKWIYSLTILILNALGMYTPNTFTSVTSSISGCIQSEQTYYIITMGGKNKDRRLIRLTTWRCMELYGFFKIGSTEFWKNNLATLFPTCLRTIAELFYRHKFAISFTSMYYALFGFKDNVHRLLKNALRCNRNTLNFGGNCERILRYNWKH